ncbi:MAG: hypothetical protein LBB89_07270 [Treponema sp.]|nr:hypothetical protein [Treponema sp.]
MKTKDCVITGILVIGFVFFGCATTETDANVVSALTVIAKGSSQGIHLYIDNIPEDTLHLSISMYDITTNDRLFVGTSLQGNELMQLRETGFLICPFVKIGHEYEITVTSLKMEEYMRTINSSTIAAVASGGVHIINDSTLVWNKNNNITTLSASPVFSDEGINI